ncbi:MAG TPA: FAD-dependent oxidoreductase, partial [Nitrososphaerales archaeon]|nr:FAD-dependent oxidoreductase [Nitrososphaerales archaeon]
SSAQARASPPGVSRAFGTRVVSVDRGSAATASGGRLDADAFVFAAGSSFERVSFEGRTKAGVRILESPESYAGLGRALAGVGRAVVAGEGARALQVAERVAAGGRRVTVLISSWQHGPPGPIAAQVIGDAARARGVALERGRVVRALGPRNVEAVLAGGEVVPCDSLAVVPRRVPGYIPSPAALGRQGGVLTGMGMESGAHGTFAAGGCAELGEGNPPHSVLDCEQGLSGRIAGANAAGSFERMPASRRTSCSAFGLVWTRVGTGSAAARAGGLEVEAVGQRHGERSSCVIAYDRAKGVALGLEVVTELARGEPALPSLVGTATLRSLAYDGALGSSDISMVSETARLGLESWSRS